MLLRVIAAFCIVDDALQAMGHKGVLHVLFPRRIHAVTQKGFVIKVLSFVLTHNLSLMAQKTLG